MEFDYTTGNIKNNAGQTIVSGNTFVSTLASNVSTTSSTLAATALSIALASGKTYEFWLLSKYEYESITSNIKISLSGPTSTFISYKFDTFFSTSLNNPSSLGAISFDISYQPTNVLQANGNYPLFAHGILTTSASGNLVVNFASGGGGTAILRSGSKLIVKEIL